MHGETVKFTMGEICVKLLLNFNV